MSVRHAIIAPEGIEFIEPGPTARQLSLELEAFNARARKAIIEAFAMDPEVVDPDRYRCLIPGCRLRAMGRRTKQFCPDHMVRLLREDRGAQLIGWRRVRGIHVHERRPPLNWEGT